MGSNPTTDGLYVRVAQIGRAIDLNTPRTTFFWLRVFLHNLPPSWEIVVYAPPHFIQKQKTTKRKTTMQMHTALIDFFKKGLVASDKKDNRDFSAINKKAVKLGYIISPECCNRFVDEWLDTLTANYNATFYKEWDDVISKSRFEIFIDQIRHYASTYGKLKAGEKIEGNGWIPNDGGTTPRFEDLKVIEPITVQELSDKCFDVLKSGVALKDSTMKVMCDFWYEIRVSLVTWKKNHLAETLSEIKNKEAVAYLSKKCGVLPADEFGMLRCLVLEYTGRADIIKSRATLDTIKKRADGIGFVSPLLNLTEEQEERLSRIFLRFKPIFLAMKGTKNGTKVCRVVNRLRRLAKTNHKPFKIGYWESIIKESRPIEDVKKRLKDIDNFRKIRLMMICRERMNFKTTSGVFTIRNGKQYVRQDYSPKYDVNWLSRLYFAIEESLCESIKSKACKVRLPEHYEIALPTSEKNFVGNFPYGTSFGMTKNNVVGVYWRNEWGTRDYDLSMSDLHGHRIGWNSDWYDRARNSSVIYSGDITNADPEAVELFYMADTAPDGIVQVNQFNGKPKSQFRFFFANECLDHDYMRNHMVDPNNIRFDTMIEHKADDVGRQMTIGMMLDNRFYLMQMGTGNRRVSSGKYAPIIIEAMKKKAKSFIPLKEVLYRAGFEVLDNDSEVKPDIDFTKLEKDTLINLFAK